MTINPRLFEIVEVATVWSPQQAPCDASYLIGLPLVGQGWVGIANEAPKFREELTGLLLELDLLALGSSGQGLCRLRGLMGDGPKFLRLWALCQELRIFPRANCALIFDTAVALGIVKGGAYVRA